MNRDMLEKALRHQYPQELDARQIEIGYEPAYTQSKNERTGKFENVPTGIPENSPDHARIAAWPAHLPKPTNAELSEWAASYAAEQPAKEAARQAKEQKRQADSLLIDSFDEGKNYTVAELKAVVAALIRERK